MAEQTPSLMTFYAGWGRSQKQLIGMIAPLSREQLAMPAGSHHWSIGSVVQHLVGNRVWWFHVWMGAGDPELLPLAHWDPADVAHTPVSDPGELIAGLETTWELVANALASWTHADLARVFSPPDALNEEERDLFRPTGMEWIIWHVIEHEILHAGELSLALGSYGLPGFYGEM